MDMTVSFAVTMMLFMSIVVTFHQVCRQFLCYFKYHKKVGAYLEPKNKVVKPSLMDMVDNNIIS